MLLAGVATAAEYDPFLLRAQASIFPKIIMLDKQAEKKTVDDNIVLNIVAEEKDMFVAESLSSLIVERYSKGIGNRKVKVVLTEFNKFNPDEMYTAYVLLSGPQVIAENIIEHAAS